MQDNRGLVAALIVRKKLSKNQEKEFFWSFALTLRFRGYNQQRERLFSLICLVFQFLQSNRYRSLNYFIAHDLSLSVVEQNNLYI